MECTKMLEKDWKPSRNQLVADNGNYLTQSLFLENGYLDSAIYTMKEFDHLHNGIWYPSLKRLYVDFEDVTEYEFANYYFSSWSQWVRIRENKIFKTLIEQCRYELELKLRARAAKSFLAQASKGGFQANKWLADKGWDVSKAGRPSKEDRDRAAKMDKDIHDDYMSDVARLSVVRS